MAWALLVVIGKYQVVEDLKGSNESEKVPRFFVRVTTLILYMHSEIPKAVKWRIFIELFINE